MSCTMKTKFLPRKEVCAFLCYGCSGSELTRQQKKNQATVQAALDTFAHENKVRGQPNTHTHKTSLQSHVLNCSRATNEEWLTLDQIWLGSVQCAGAEKAATFASSSTALLL